MSDRDDDDDGGGAGQAIVQALSGQGSTPLGNDFLDAFHSIQDQQGLGFGSRASADGTGGYSGLSGMDLTGPAAHVDVNANMQQATQFFVSKGWTQAQAVGIVANLYAESRLNPGAHGDGGHAYGIGQWHEDRQAAFASRFGTSIQGASLNQQLEFVNYELTQGSEQRAGNMLRGATDARSAAAIVSQYYERPADRYGQAQARASIAAGIEGRIASWGSNLASAVGYTGHRPDYAPLSTAAGTPDTGHYIVIGDSLAQGMGNAMAASGMNVDNRAVGGSGLFNQAGVDWVAQAGQIANSAHAGDHIVLMMGRNDVGASPEATAARANRLMAELKTAQARGVDVEVVSPIYAGDKDAVGVQQVADIYHQAALRNGLAYVDVNRNGAIARGGDGIHMAQRGYAELASRAMTGVQANNAQNTQLASNTTSTGISGFVHKVGAALGFA